MASRSSIPFSEKFLKIFVVIQFRLHDSTWLWTSEKSELVLLLMCWKVEIADQFILRKKPPFQFFENKPTLSDI